MNQEFREILGVLSRIPMATPCFSPSEFHMTHFTLEYTRFLLTDGSMSFQDYLREKELNSVTATVAYAMPRGLSYDPFVKSEPSFEDEYIVLLHQVLGEAPDEQFTREQYQWVLGGLMVGQGGTTESLRKLFKQLEDPKLRSSETGYRVLVRDAATHVELPPLPK